MQGTKVLLLKPQIFMNRSGLSVGEAAHFYKIAAEERLLVVGDDLDLDPGVLRLRLSGGSGGHNGLNSIIETLGGEKFPRLRIGIGLSKSTAAESYVLQAIPKREQSLFEEAIKQAADGIELLLQTGVSKAMNSLNKKKSKEVSDGT